MAQHRVTFVVEHLDPELEAWSALEYTTIAKESRDTGCEFILSCVPTSLLESAQLREIQANVRSDSIESHLADQKSRICLLDPAAKEDLRPKDAEHFDFFLFGGILGDDPPRDRTSELRKKGFAGRRLGPKQMTTDTAVRVTRMVIVGQMRLDQITCVDCPELKLDEHESTEMPFRYVIGKDGAPIMPPGMLALIKADANKAFDGLELADETEGMGELEMS